MASSQFSTPKKSITSVLSQPPQAPKRVTTKTLVSQHRPVVVDNNYIEKSLSRNRKQCLTGKNIDPKTFIKTLDGRQGLYFISGDDFTKSPDVMLKIGKASNLKNRIKSYLFCFPGGFYIYGIILTKQSNVTEAKSAHHLTEQNLHQYLRYLNLNISQPHGHSGEWFLVKSEDVTKVFITALSVASEQGLAPEPYCYAFFPPIFVKETQANTLPRKVMNPKDANELETQINEADRFQGPMDPVLQSNMQAARGLSRKATQNRKSLSDDLQNASLLNTTNVSENNATDIDSINYNGPMTRLMSGVYDTTTGTPDGSSKKRRRI